MITEGTLNQRHKHSSSIFALNPQMVDLFGLGINTLKIPIQLMLNDMILLLTNVGERGLFAKPLPQDRMQFFFSEVGTLAACLFQHLLSKEGIWMATARVVAITLPRIHRTWEEKLY